MLQLMCRLMKKSSLDHNFTSYNLLIIFPSMMPFNFNLIAVQRTSISCQQYQFSKSWLFIRNVQLICRYWVSVNVNLSNIYWTIRRLHGNLTNVRKNIQFGNIEKCCQLEVWPLQEINFHAFLLIKLLRFFFPKSSHHFSGVKICMKIEMVHKMCFYEARFSWL